MDTPNGDAGHHSNCNRTEGSSCDALQESHNKDQDGVMEVQPESLPDEGTAFLKINSTTETAEPQGDPSSNEPPPSKRIKIFMTVCLFSCTLIEGLCFGVRAATLFDIQRNTSASVWEVSAGLITSLSVGWVAGGLVGGILFDKLNQQLYLGCSALASAVCVLAAPWFGHIAVVAIFYGLMGFWLAFMDAGALTLMVQVWQKQSGPYVQAQEMFFGLGSLIGPLIVDIFQAASDRSYPHNNHINFNITYNSSSSDNMHNRTLYNSSLLNETSAVSDESKRYNHLFQYVYIIPASLCVVVSVPFFINSMQGRFLRPQEMSKEEKEHEKSKSKFHIRLLVLMAVACSIYNGMEDTSSGLLKSFVVEHVGFSQSKGNLLLSVYWGVYTSYRIIGMLEFHYLHPGTILIIHQGALVAGYLLLLGVHLHPSVTWIAVVFIGISNSPIFATNITWMDRYVQMKGKIMAIIFVAEGAGSTVCPPLIGKLIESSGYRSFLYTMIGMNVVGFILRSVMHVYARRHGERYREDEKDEEMEVELKSPLSEPDSHLNKRV